MSVPTPPGIDAACKTAADIHGLVIELATRRALPAALAAQPGARAHRVRLTDWQRMEVEQARKLLMDAPGLFGSHPAAYVAGLIEGVASNLLDIIDAVTEV